VIGGLISAIVLPARMLSLAPAPWTGLIAPKIAAVNWSAQRSPSSEAGELPLFRDANKRAKAVTAPELLNECERRRDCGYRKSLQ
jgi:hypothetical protein